jgi:hypothetical protein
MARQFLTTAIVLFAAMAVLAPAQAQFGSIFGGPPPRPPADVPRRAPSNLPPAEPLPAPMSLPPARRPGADIETQPLPPPPGNLAPPSSAPANRTPNVVPGGAPNTTAIQPAPNQPTPGLSPGQRQPRGVPQQVTPQPTVPQQAAPETPPSDEIVVQPPEQKIANPTAVFSGLDKITGRTISFDVAINETVQFGALQVTPRVCYSRPPTETPRTDAFVAVDEVTLQGEVRRIFTGWMFASSPGLHAVEHPIYDVWLTECKGGTPAVAADVPAPAKPAPAAQTAKPKPAAPPPKRALPPPNFLSPFR